jgi:hypothetical protein
LKENPMPLKVGCSKEVRSHNIRTLIREGYPPKVASAIAYDLARKHKKMCKVNPPPPKRRGKRASLQSKKKKRKKSIFDIF